MSSSQLSFVQAKGRLAAAYAAAFSASSPPGAKPKPGLGPVWAVATPEDQTTMKKALMGSIVKIVSDNEGEPAEYWFTKQATGCVNFNSVANPKLLGTRRCTVAAFTGKPCKSSEQQQHRQQKQQQPL